jgi:zinc D-Ala-D-Ala carboxypeptidase
MKKLMRYALPVLGTALAGGLATAVVAAPASAATVRPLTENQFCSYTNAEPELEYGNTGVAVQQAQCELDSVINGPVDLPSDGIFGTETEQWTKQFQACMGIAQDGIIGPITWSKLDYYSSTQAPQPCDN